MKDTIFSIVLTERLEALGWNVRKSTDLDGTYEIRSKDCFLRLTEKEMNELELPEVIERMLAAAYRSGKSDGYDCGIEAGRIPG